MRIRILTLVSWCSLAFLLAACGETTTQFPNNCGDCDAAECADGDSEGCNCPDGDLPDGDKTDGDIDGDTDADVEVDGDEDGDTDADVEVDGDEDGDTDGDVEVDGDEDGDTDGDVEVDGDEDGDTDGDVEVDGDEDGDTDGDVEVDGDEDGDTDGDVEVDGDEDGDTDGDVEVDGDEDGDTDGDVEVDGDEVDGDIAPNPCEVDDPCAATNQVCINSDGVAVCGVCLSGFHFNSAGDACTDDLCDPNPCAGAQTYNRSCNPQTGACECGPDFCDIDGLCIPNGTVNPYHTCQACDTATTLSDWSPRPNTTICRAAVDGCDVDDYCDGQANDCPADGFAVYGTGCGDDSETSCDNPDICDGNGACVADVEPTTTVCREAATDCDAPEYCDGLGACPADRFLAAGAFCGDAGDSVCDRRDSCDGNGSCLENIEPITTVCRAAIDGCDVDEFCDGSGACPADGFAVYGTGCGSEHETVCDKADICDGNGLCIANVEPTDTVCRAATGECDVAETCDEWGDCPEDAFAAIDAPCGSSGDSDCDNPDSCDGNGYCLTNIEPSTTLCRAAATDCDAAEYCDGLGACPGDAFLPVGAFCGDGSDTACDNPDSCDGNGTCLNNHEANTVVCREAADLCDLEETCTDGVCPVDGVFICPEGEVCEPETGNCVDAVANVPPVAALTCPEGGAVAETLIFDASASSDEDGAIVSYALAFDDGVTSTGASDTIYHVYSAAGLFTVNLTVTDNRGGSDTASCDVLIIDGSTPQVVLVRPMEDLIVSQGYDIIVEADVTPAPGRTIAQTQLMADGVLIGSPDDEVPYRFTYHVDELQPTGDIIELRVQATDNEGAVGVSNVRTLDVRNYFPEATFTAIITNNLEVTVDAGGVSDVETATADLEVRWDWDNDGTYDTDWSTTKVAVHTYTVDGEHTMGMQVRDAVDQRSETTRTIDFQMTQDVSGEITTTLWMGTIRITGDAWVPQGEVLRIASGTTVIFYGLDTNEDSIGDFDLTIHGQLLVEGTEAAPVTFTVLGDLEPSEWNQISLASDSTGVHDINHAIIEYAHYGLLVSSEATIRNSEFRQCDTAIRVYNSLGVVTVNDTLVRDTVSEGVYVYNSELVSDGLTVQDCGDQGVYVYLADSVAFNNCLLTRNTGHGAQIERSTNVDFDSCEVTYNGDTGLFWYGSSTGDVTHNNIKYNDSEGVRLLPYSGTNPTPVINYNNIFGNAVVRALVSENIGLSVSTTGSFSSGYSNSAVWATPNGEDIMMVGTTFSDYDSSTSYISGYLMNAQTNLAIYTYSADTSFIWYDISSTATDSIFVRVYDGHSSYYGSMTASWVAYAAEGQAIEMTAITQSGSINARHNYFGAFPDVLSVLSYNQYSLIDIQGFVGDPYDGSWDKGNYVGGETITGVESWDVDKTVTGNVTISTGGRLTIGPGVTVTFIPTDMNGNNGGDWRIQRTTGDLVVSGTAAEPVTFTSQIAKAMDYGWQYLQNSGGGGTTTISHAIIERAYDGVQLADGSLAMDHVTLRYNDQRGIYVTGDNHLFTGDYLTLEYNGTWGLYMYNAKDSGSSLTNSTIRHNPEGGIYLYGSQIDIGWSNIQYNKVGVQIEYNTEGLISNSNIKYNSSDGILLVGDGSTNPTVVINNNNIFGNGTVEAGYYEAISLVATTTGSYTSGNMDSGTYSSGTEAIEYYKCSFNDYDSSTSNISGYVRSGTENLRSFIADTSARWYPTNRDDITSLYARVYDAHSSYYGTMSITGVFYHMSTVSPARVVELSAVLSSGVLDATGNFWGPFDASFYNRFIMVTTNSVDVSGFKTDEYASLGPQPE